MVEDLLLDLKRLAEVDPHDLGDDETIVALHRAKAVLEAVTARATASWDARRGFAEQHRSGVTWLAARCHLAPDDASRELRRGRACRMLPVAEDAWLNGEIDGRHVDLLAAKRNDRTAERMDADEAMLVGHAGRLTYRCFVRALRYWEQCADPDGVEADARSRVDEERMHLSQTFDGMWVGDLVLSPVSGSIVNGVLASIEQELFEADWAEARARVGDAATAADLARTPAQRRAQAMVEMATRAAATPPGARRPAPLFTVLVGYETFAGRICELADGTVVTPGSLVPWLTEAHVERIVFDSPSRVIDVGRRRRLFTGALRRAIEVRDRTCYVDGCDEPAATGQVDHVQPWALGGATTQENGRTACRFHNLLRNRRPNAP